MEKQTVKERIMAVQTSLMEDLMAQVPARMEAADMDEADTMDPEDFSQSDAQSNFARELNLQVGETQRALEFLHNIPTSEQHDAITVGSLVTTNKYTFYIGIGAEPFEMEGRTIVGLSPKAPLFGVMRGKKKGDTFGYGSANYEILDVK